MCTERKSEIYEDALGSPGRVKSGIRAGEGIKEAIVTGTGYEKK